MSNVQAMPLQDTSISAEFGNALGKDVSSKALYLMAELTLLAIGKGLLSSADLIVSGLTACFSTHLFVPMLAAAVAGAEGRHADALQIYERLLKSNGHNSNLLCTVASLRKEFGVSGWRTLAQRVIDRGDDADAIGVAEALLAGPTNHTANTPVASTEAGLAGLRFA